MNRQQLIELAKEAEQIAETVSDNYKEILFTRALDELIKSQAAEGGQTDFPRSQPLPQTHLMRAYDRQTKLQAILNSHLDIGDGQKLLDAEGTLERALLVLEIADGVFRQTQIAGSYATP